MNHIKSITIQSTTHAVDDCNDEPSRDLNDRHHPPPTLKLVKHPHPPHTIHLRSRDFCSNRWNTHPTP